jgi:hypothetical protein
LGRKGVLLSGEFNRFLNQGLDQLFAPYDSQLAVAKQVLQQSLAKEEFELHRLLVVNVIKTQKMVEPFVQSLWKANDRELCDKLHDNNPLIRWFVVDILSRRQAHVEKELIGLLNDPYLEVRSAARQALVRLARGTDFGPNPRDGQAQIQRAVSGWQSWLERQDPIPRGRLASPGADAFDRYFGEKKSQAEQKK